MTISSRIAILALTTLAFIACDNKEQTEMGQESLGSFVYEGDTYQIRSVVLYELDNNQTQIWISETAGYTTVDEIEASVGELVITVPDSKIGQGKYSDDKELEGRFIKYDDKVNSGWMALSCSIDKANKNISIQFSSQTLKSAKNAIEGSYSGPYSEYTLPVLENQWAYNRQRKGISSVEFFEMEDGAPSRFVVYENHIPAVEIFLDPSKVGVPVTLGIGNPVPVGTQVFFDDGEEFGLSNVYGNITVNPAKDNISISLKLTNERGKTLAAEYVGAYRHRFGNKTNRCIFDSGSDGYGYNGKFEINSMSVIETSSDITFTFIPGEHLSNGHVDQNLIPTLKVSKNLVNVGEIDIKGTSYPWQFQYHNFQVYSFDPSASDKTTAGEGSVLSIERNSDGTYAVNIEVGYMLKKTVTQNKVDENGNIVYEWVQKKDENNIPLFDENDEPIMEQVPVKVQVEIEVPATVDLFFRGSAN